jgi:hypothetical protein
MKNWQTTVVGIIGALIIALQTIANTIQTGEAINWWQIGLAFVIATLGIVAKDAFGNTPTTIFVLLVLASPFMTSCASTQTALVSGTLSNGDKFPLCLEITEKSPIGGMTLLAAFCANAQMDIEQKATQYRTMYGPNARIVELIGPEKRQL